MYKEEFIKKAVEWLDEFTIDDFKQAMEINN